MLIPSQVYCDGGSRGNPGPAASAFVVISTTNQIITSSGKYIGVATNNIAEYSAVILALEWVNQQVQSQAFLKQSLNKLNFFLDSQLVVNQLVGQYKIKNSSLLQRAQEIHQHLLKLPFSITFSHIPRYQNHLADSQVNQVLDNLHLSQS